MGLRRLAVSAGVFLFAAACGGGGGSTGATGAAAGSATGGTSSGGSATTGGTSTGGALDAGAQCTDNVQCQSTFCGIDGAQGGASHCCAVECTTGDGGCGATGCDATGACVYPGAGTSCGADFCGANKLTPRVCNGSGDCASGTGTTCPGNLGCNAAGTACDPSCANSKDCAGGYVCNAGACVAPLHIGPCTENDDCYSGVCGLDGTGYCCYSTTPCVTGDPTCGATGCEPSNGACNYADAGTACGSVLASCSADVQQSPSICDGKGTCPAPKMVDCTPYICGATACITTCTDDTSCGTGDFCDVAKSSCCPGPIAGGTLHVDATGGTDAVACCGLSGFAQCQTIARTMQIIDAAQAKDVTIAAQVNKGSTWTPPGEVYPIVLGWGVELQAPGVFFSDANSNAEIFDIKAYSTNDTLGYASVVGTAKAPVTIGVDEFRTQTTDSSAIQVESGGTLYLANASVNGNETKASTAITVGAGGTLVVAQDKSAGVTGTVTIGNALANSQTNGYKGIVCLSGKGVGCTIRDAVLKAGQSSLIVEGQQYVDIDAEDYASITLTSAPVIGLAPAAVGFKQCATKYDVQNNESGANPAAVLLNGAATMTFDNGTVQCISGDAFLLNATANGTPSLTLDGTTIQNTEFGVKANAGSATVSNSNIQYNFNGVEQGTDGTHISTVDLSSGGDGGTTTVACSSSYESLHGRTVAGASVINATSAALNAQNVDWDTSSPDYFQCNAALTTCTCEISSCTVSVADAGFDGLDAVYTSTGSVETSGNGTSPLNCTAPAKGGCVNCGPLGCCGNQCCL